jgi:hypothetical protein
MELQLAIFVMHTHYWGRLPFNHLLERPTHQEIAQEKVGQPCAPQNQAQTDLSPRPPHHRNRTRTAANQGNGARTSPRRPRALAQQRNSERTAALQRNRERTSSGGRAHSRSKEIRRPRALAQQRNHARSPRTKETAQEPAHSCSEEIAQERRPPNQEIAPKSATR